MSSVNSHHNITWLDKGVTERDTPWKLPMTIIKVSAQSRTTAVAGAIAGVMREYNRVEVQAIGAGAVNQSVKAIIIAKGYLAEEGVNIVCTPSFVEVVVGGQERTAVRLLVEPSQSHS
jgi:stage V sporulation protein S